MRKDELDAGNVRCECDGRVYMVPKMIFSTVMLSLPGDDRKFVRYKEGARIYGMSVPEFIKISNMAEATIKVGKMVLVSIEKMDKYFSYF